MLSAAPGGVEYRRGSRVIFAVAAGQPEAWPAPPLVDPPKPIRAIYLNAWAFGGRRFDELVKLADTTEINAFVIDIENMGPTASKAFEDFAVEIASDNIKFSSKGDSQR